MGRGERRLLLAPALLLVASLVALAAHPEEDTGVDAGAGVTTSAPAKAGGPPGDDDGSGRPGESGGHPEPGQPTGGRPSGGTGATPSGPGAPSKPGSAPGSGSGAGSGGGGAAPTPCAPGAGATDVGVTNTEIKVATYPVTRPSAAPSATGVRAVVDRVNRAGGVCGRRISLKILTQSTFPPPDSFALVAPAVNDRLHQALADGEVDRSGVPVVGGAGGAPAQFASRLAWPGGPSTDDAVRVMVNHAWDTGARSFALVHDANSLYGDPAAAFEAAVRAKTGAAPKAVVRLTPGAASYRSQADAFTKDCGCDFVGLSLLRESASTWLHALPDEGNGRKEGFGTKVTGLTPSLLAERFRQDCGSSCHNAVAWSGYAPDTAYAEAVRAIDPTVDVVDPAVEGGYVGAELFVRALEEAGGNLTRARLRQVLDGMTYKAPMVTDLRWTADQRAANRAFRAFAFGSVDPGPAWHRP